MIVITVDNLFLEDTKQNSENLREGGNVSQENNTETISYSGIFKGILDDTSSYSQKPSLLNSSDFISQSPDNSLKN
jgi:hypothetical protein